MSGAGGSAASVVLGAVAPNPEPRIASRRIAGIVVTNRGAVRKGGRQFSVSWIGRVTKRNVLWIGVQRGHPAGATTLATITSAGSQRRPSRSRI